MKKMICIQCMLQLNAMQKRYLQYHMIHTLRMYQECATKLELDKIYSIAEIMEVIKQHQDPYMKVMEKQELYTMAWNLTKACKRKKHHTVIIIHNCDLYYRGLHLKRYMKYPYNGERMQFCYAKLIYVKQQMMLKIYVKKCYKNDRNTR